MFRTSAAVIAAVVILVQGCAEAPSSGEATVDSAPTRTEVTTTSIAPTTVSDTSLPSAARTTSSTTDVAPSTTHAPTEQVAGPPPGSEWIVVAVGFDDVLNVRAGPGVTYAVIGSLDPMAAGIRSTGSAVIVNRSIWWEIPADGALGWVNSRYLSAEGSTTDLTSLVVELNGSIPAATTMDELASIVAGILTQDDTRGVVVGAAGSGDLTEVSVDVLPGTPDDSVRGQRLRIFGQKDGGAGPYSLYAVEATLLCWRGADEFGQCA